MRQVTVTLPHHTYDVLIEPGLLHRVGSFLHRLAPGAACTILSDAQVAALYGARVASSLTSAGYRVGTHAFVAGEHNKNLATVQTLYNVLLDARHERNHPVLALGGGVTGDLVGFVASTYLRGVPFVQCPTTLLAMVDASVGGKVGVDVPQGKNLIGSFYQPTLVAIDPETLLTLPERDLRSGLAECVKHALLAGSERFTWLEENLPAIQALDLDVLSLLVEWNVAFKARVVMEDEREAGIRAWLNLGHTFAHAIESTTGYSKFQHGEAVALGLVAATWVSVETGPCSQELATRLTQLLTRIALPIRATLPNTDTLIEAMQFDKKVTDGTLRLILLDGMGRPRIDKKVHPRLLRAAWETIRS